MHEEMVSRVQSVCPSNNEHSFENGDTIKLTSCHHLFHERCLDDWLVHCESRPKCPQYGIFRCARDPYESVPLQASEGPRLSEQENVSNPLLVDSRDEREIPVSNRA